MERLHEYLMDDSVLGSAPEDGGRLLEPEFVEHEEAVEEPVSTDDPVRAYLREMGSVRLLSRQGEIDLAKRMERGKLRVRKALSRSPIVWQRVLAMQEQIRAGEIRLEDIIELGIEGTRRLRSARKPG